MGAFLDLSPPWKFGPVTDHILFAHVVQGLQESREAAHDTFYGVAFQDSGLGFVAVRFEFHLKAERGIGAEALPRTFAVLGHLPFVRPLMYESIRHVFDADALA